MSLPRQCAILAGGLGTRLGTLTADTPKPLLDVGGRPFLAWLLRELSRFGIEDVVLLAGYRSTRVSEFLDRAPRWLPKELGIRVSIEPSPAGTGGALRHASALLDDSFLLINGDSWLDTNLARFMAGASRSDSLCHVLLRAMPDVARYGQVELVGDRILAFRPQAGAPGPGLINGGVYVLHKQVLEFVPETASLERDVFPILAERGLLTGQVVEGYFIDIGVPADYARAQAEFPERLRRPAVFFDRDGVLNRDHGWVGTRERFEWQDGARQAVASANDAGYHAFVVTNQAGVAKGFYSEADVVGLHRWMQEDLLRIGATIDDLRYCPHHPQAVLPAYRKDCSDRKPGSGMLLDLATRWEIDMARSFLVGDKESDEIAAVGAGIRGYRFNGGDLSVLVAELLKASSKLKGAQA